jgi:hypothetical protein
MSFNSTRSSVLPPRFEPTGPPATVGGVIPEGACAGEEPPLVGRRRSRRGAFGLDRGFCCRSPPWSWLPSLLLLLCLFCGRSPPRSWQHRLRSDGLPGLGSSRGTALLRLASGREPATNPRPADGEVRSGKKIPSGSQVLQPWRRPVSQRISQRAFPPVSLPPTFRGLVPRG